MFAAYGGALVSSLLDEAVALELAGIIIERCTGTAHGEVERRILGPHGLLRDHAPGTDGQSTPRDRTRLRVVQPGDHLRAR